MTLDNVLDRLIMISGFKGRFILDDSKNSDSQCPHVYFTIVSPSKKHLRSLVVKCSCVCEHINFVTPLKSTLTYSEIDDLDSSR